MLPLPLYRLQQARKLVTQHSIRLFEIFQTVIDSETQTGAWVVTVVEMKRILRIQNKYDRWIDFKNKVIIPSVKQVNETTSLEIDWDIYSKEGKRITELIFTVKESIQMNLFDTEKPHAED